MPLVSVTALPVPVVMSSPNCKVPPTPSTVILRPTVIPALKNCCIPEVAANVKVADPNNDILGDNIRLP